MTKRYAAVTPFVPKHPTALAVYCSDGRFTRAIEELLRELGHDRLGTLTMPGGPAERFDSRDVVGVCVGVGVGDVSPQVSTLDVESCERSPTPTPTPTRTPTNKAWDCRIFKAS